MSPVDDYIDDYDSKITKMNQLLERDLEYWKSKIQMEEEEPEVN